MSCRPPTQYSPTVLSNEPRLQQSPLLRRIVDILQELHVVRVNMTAMNEARFTIAYCLQFKILKVKKPFRNIVLKTTGFLNLWPYTCLFHILRFPINTCTLQTFTCKAFCLPVKFSLKNAMLYIVLAVSSQIKEPRCCVILSD